jgi:4-hydroxythreonine-4-phosphate dehydrogenase
MTRLRIGLTVGDPGGIGPEVCAHASEDPKVQTVCESVVYGPMAETAVAAYRTGAPSAEGGRVAYEAIQAAVSDALAGRLDAVVTAPISKAGWALAGLPWRGHTDLLAHLTGASDVAMMFHADRLCVVLATVHIPLAEVPKQLTRARVERTIRLAHDELPWLGWSRPRLALAGLNPHAGEHGLMGDEDERVLRPAVAAARQVGIDVTGPLPGDTVFVRALKGEFDAVIACYHDQGLIPVKLAAFGSSVNVTLGLPIVRTSVDHGTAYDIAGRGTADPGSMIQAVLLAARLATARAPVSHD